MPLVHPDAAVKLAGPSWLVDRRAEALASIEESGLPSSKEEVWRYSPIDDLDPDRYHAQGGPVEASIPTSLSQGAAVVMVGRDGTVEIPGDLSGVTVSTLGIHAEAQDLLGAAAGFHDPIVALSTAQLADGVVVDVPRGSMVASTILLVHPIGAGTTAGRTIVRLADGAAATVIELFIGGDGEVLNLPVAELLVGDGANLRYGSLQMLGRSAWHLATIDAVVGRDATVSQLTAGLGGAYDRCRTDVVLDGQGASSVLRSTYLGDGSQIHDLRTKQDHVAPKTISDLLCKGAVADTSRSVYSGLIKMRHGAIRSNAMQTNHNLVLSESAHADSVPNLDISENDVRCSHASTVGPIDEDQRYYLESRGIPRPAAENLLIRGFFADLLERPEAAPAGAVIAAEVDVRLAALDLS